MRKSKRVKMRHKDNKTHLKGRTFKDEDIVRQFSCTEGWSVTLPDQTKYRVVRA